MIVSSVIASDRAHPVLYGGGPPASNFFIYGTRRGLANKDDSILRSDVDATSLGIAHNRGHFVNNKWWIDPVLAMAELERMSTDPDDIWFSTVWDHDEEIYEVNIAHQDGERQKFELYPYLMSKFQVFIICKNTASMSSTMVCDSSFATLDECLDFASWFKRKSLSIQIRPSFIADSGRPSFYIYDRRCDQAPERMKDDEDFAVLHSELGIGRFHWHNNYKKPYDNIGWIY